MAPYFPRVYYLDMAGESFRQKALEALNAQGMSKADLSRRSGVPYHTLDKFLKRRGATTAHENAVAIAQALGISPDGESDYDELRQLFFQLDEEGRRFAVAALRGLLHKR